MRGNLHGKQKMFNTLNKIVQYIEQNCTAAETAGMPRLDSPEPARHGDGKKRIICQRATRAEHRRITRAPRREVLHKNHLRCRDELYGN